MLASGESSTTMHRLLHASESHPIPPPNDPKCVGKRVKVRRLSCRVSMTFLVVRTNQYNQDLGLIHSTNGNHLESPNEGSSIDHQVTIYLHAQNITMFPTNETWVISHRLISSRSVVQGERLAYRLIRGPQQPSDVQIRDSAVSGSAGRTQTFAQSVEVAQRRSVETVLDADRNAGSLGRQAAA
ncbi:hypothetical protein F511_09653 [Dorcoceras hygrometricum]|uniref:Uncharacterized protein n=1 Tax=Dorcoceras hygrometricum TaxID=472368 RepID=A0A2Z7AAU5_9LAMI|nr:hypothetical protein F511_09653 [Dorcoceras hygrometricum]